MSIRNSKLIRHSVAFSMEEICKILLQKAVDQRRLPSGMYTNFHVSIDKRSSTFTLICDEKNDETT